MKTIPQALSTQETRDKLADNLRQYRRWRDDERKSKARYEKMPGWDFMADKCDDIAEDWQDIARAYLQALIDVGVVVDIWGAMVTRDKAKEIEKCQ